MPSLFRRLSCFRRTRPPPSVPSIKDSTITSKRDIDEEKPATNSGNAPATTRNVLKFALKTLSVASANVPFASLLSAAIEPLLAITDRIEQISSNAQGLIELAARIELLTPIVSQMTEDSRGERVIGGLQRELQSITRDLEVARSQGKLDQFFNSVDNTSSLQKHNMNLAQLIADSTLVTVHEVLKSVRDIERTKFQLDVAEESTFEPGHITGKTTAADPPGP
ncbi:hypothetical protein C8F04DRAFT_1080284 [Mycena alexandri]|uniref:Uncharacterized protein n=1 Tax=Mycena alexandri TaxID=1745969 RepID=A0AAD6X6R8_9AGAR|nr:hypothetical protein C8F04DRAFT_1080284 [Mycena alexandri]